MKINTLENRLRGIITEAANKNIGRKKITNSAKSWLTPEITQAITKKNHLRESMKENRKEWADECRNISEMIKVEKAARWKDYIEQLDTKTTDKELWRTIHNLDGNANNGGKSETLNVDGIAYVSDRDKANQFAKTYKAYSKLPTRKEDREIRRRVRKALSKTPTAMEESEVDITKTELERAISESKMNKAAGEDDLPYELLKHLGPKAKGMILHIFNRCWSGEELPTMWRTAIIKPLLKEGKDPKETVSYRPISLTSCLGKIFEKIVADRLMCIMEQRNLINENQAGFRQNRATTDQVLKLIQSASDQLHSKKEEPLTMCTFFDYEKAYDKVWRDGLLYKMAELGLPWKFMKYV